MISLGRSRSPSAIAAALRGIVGLCVLLPPVPVLASFNGGLDFGFGFMFVAAFLIATPGAVAVLLTERLGTGLAARPLFGYIGIAIVVGASVLAHGWENYNRQPFYLLLVPPAGAVAIRTFVTSAQARLIATWLAALVGVLMGYLGLHGEFPGIVRDRSSLLGLLNGGAAASLLFWHIGHYLSCRARTS